MLNVGMLRGHLAKINLHRARAAWRFQPPADPFHPWA